MSMKKTAKPAWYGIAAVTIGTGIFFLATNKGRLFKKGAASLKGLLSGPADPNTVTTPGGSSTAGRTPTPANGHVRDVNASTPPPPDSGSNFTPQGDVHSPQG